MGPIRPHKHNKSGAVFCHLSDHAFCSQWGRSSWPLEIGEVFAGPKATVDLVEMLGRHHVRGGDVNPVVGSGGGGGGGGGGA